MIDNLRVKMLTVDGKKKTLNLKPKAGQDLALAILAALGWKVALSKEKGGKPCRT